MALGAADDQVLTDAWSGGHGDGAAGARASPSAMRRSATLRTQPGNVSLGTRVFGSDPAASRPTRPRSCAASSAAVSWPRRSTSRAFGAVGVDPHYASGSIEAGPDVARRTRSSCPSGPRIEAGAGMVMSAHVALPVMTGDRDAARDRVASRGHARPAATRARFPWRLHHRRDGHACDRAGHVPASSTAIVALRAGVDLLLLTPDRAAQRRLEAGLRQAALRGLVPDARCARQSARILAPAALAGRLPGARPGVIRSAAHEALARRPLGAAITLVRDDDGLLPLRPAAGSRVAVITPAPRDLTPADSSVDEPLDLAAARCATPPRSTTCASDSLPTTGHRARAASRFRGMPGGSSARSRRPSSVARCALSRRSWALARRP